MSPTTEVYSRFREPSNFDSDFASEHVRNPDPDFHRFPSKYIHVDDPRFVPADAGAVSHSRTHPQHYVDSESATNSRLASRSRTTSSARRNRKVSGSTARDLVRALIHERLEVDSSAEVRLARAYDIIREESNRAAQAERAAHETAERLKAIAISRASVQKDVAKAQSELKAYKLQLENARRQLEEANAIAAASEADRIRAEQAARKMKHAVEKLRLSEAVRRAREEGRREGLHESRYGVPARSSPGVTVPFIEDDDDDVILRTPTSNVPLPVPPLDVAPIISRRAATPTAHRSQTPSSGLRGPQGARTPVPEVIRQNITPPTRHSQTPQLPVPPPASFPILSRRAESPGAHRGFPIHDEFDPVPPPGQGLHINPVPDHIIIRSPVPRHAPSAAHPAPQSIIPSRPPSSQTSRPRSTQGPQTHHRSRPQPPHHARHHSFDDPAARATASAVRIYGSSTESSDGELFVQRPPSRILRRRDDLPQQETIVPRPAPGPGQRSSPPDRHPSGSDSIPASAAAFARARAREGHRYRPAPISSSTSSPKAFPTPSSVARLQRLPLGDRRASAESASSIPVINIEPPSRPESVDSLATGVTLPSHMSPFIDSDSPLPDSTGAQASGWGGMPPQSHPQHQPRPQGVGHPPRPSSRTGFMYGTPIVDDPGTPGASATGFGSPPSPRMARTMPFAGPSSQSVPPPPPALPGSAADYFSGDHRQSRHTNGHAHPRVHEHEHGSGHRHGHRREPAGVSVENLGTADPDAFHDRARGRSLDSDEDAEFRAPTPRARTFDESRGGLSSPRSVADSSHRRSSTSVGFIPPRPPSSSSATGEDYAFSPRRVPLPGSSATSAHPSRSGSITPGPHGHSGRSRKTTLMSGRTGGGGGPSGRPASRTSFGNTPFVRSSGLYDD